VAIGEGWTPAGLRPEQLKEALRTLKRMCEEARRDFNAIEISANVPPLKKSAARAAIEQYEAAGAHRVTTILVGSAFDQDPAALEKAADAFLG
jgi:alkanesulfonate monooxygenase SsuD/methylene tetrahydromethanopterin reductase-like flavin-dependent oxidoreductase (luciferase family)